MNSLPDDRSLPLCKASGLGKKKSQLQNIANLCGTLALEKRCTGFSARWILKLTGNFSRSSYESLVLGNKKAPVL